MDRCDSGPRDANRGATYIYTTTLMPGRKRFALGMPSLRPPRNENGWELCAVSRLEAGLLVSWRRVVHFASGYTRG